MNLWLLRGVASRSLQTQPSLRYVRVGDPARKCNTSCDKMPVVDSSVPAARKPRPGGRSARIREAVLNAAFAELGEKGYDGFSMEAVARRSGVHKTTVYRRWPTRDALVVDALDSRAHRHSPISRTGSLRADLRLFAEDVFAKLSSPHGKAMLKSLVSAVD